MVPSSPIPPRSRLLAARASWWIVALVDEEDVESIGIIERWIGECPPLEAGHWCGGSVPC